ncbi:hypothetical protein HK100_006840 [Physocladia obscura]|uniref:Uncharacterized protein n=1 Tax=Physocladia obscura TaxID=109957 RepID=A0AAD5SRP9_9FUNG|nr:hypothetical protein HK100_006840 [Physocladia obscura]
MKRDFDGKSRYQQQTQDVTAVTALCISFLEAGEYETLRGLASMFLNERVDALDSVSYDDKLHVYVWGLRDAWELDHIRTALHRFSSLHVTSDEMRMWFRKIDSVTLQAAVLFDELISPSLLVSKNSFSSDEQPSSSSLLRKSATGPGPSLKEACISTLMILHRNVDSWEYHDIKVSLDWDQEWKKHWVRNVDEAKTRFEEAQLAAKNWEDTQSIVSDDRAYWDSYIVAEVKPTSTFGNSKSVDEDEMENDDDYWNQYDNNLSRF